MKNQKGNSELVAIVLVLGVVLCAPWVINAVKFLDCDFKPDYKCEVVHGIGVVIPPMSYLTVWIVGK